MSCVAYGCTNRAARKMPGITFHRFPSNERLRKAWTIAVKRKNWHPTAYSRICSVHFSEDVIDRSLARVYLKENAIPSIFPGHPTKKKATKRFSKYRTQGKKDNDPEVSVSKNLDLSLGATFTRSEENHNQRCNSFKTWKEKGNNVFFKNGVISKNVELSTGTTFTSSGENPILLCNTSSTWKNKVNDSSLEDIVFSESLELSSNATSTNSEENHIQPCNTSLSDEINDYELQPSDEESESEDDADISDGKNIITFCDTSQQSSSPSSFVAKVVNILNSSPSPAAVVKPPSCAESLQLIQNIVLQSRKKEDQEKDMIRRDIRRNSSFNDAYCRKIKLMQQMLAIQEKKVEVLKRVTSSLKKERIIE